MDARSSSHNRSEKPAAAGPLHHASPARKPSGDKTFAVIKRSIIINGHKTSVSLEDAFWDGLKDIALRQEVSLTTLIGKIEDRRATSNLSSAIRLFVLDHFRGRAFTDVMIGIRQSADTPHNVQHQNRVAQHA